MFSRGIRAGLVVALFTWNGVSGTTVNLTRRLNYEDCARGLGPSGSDRNQCIKTGNGGCTLTLLTYLPAASDNTEAGVVIFDNNCNSKACYYVGPNNCDGTSNLDTGARGLAHDISITLHGCDITGDTPPTFMYNGAAITTCYASEDNSGLAGGYAYRCPFSC